MGCIFSKGDKAGTKDAEVAPPDTNVDKSSRRLFSMQRDEATADASLDNSGGTDTAKNRAKLQGSSVVTPAPPTPENVEAVTRNASGHHRRATVDVGGKAVEPERRADNEEEHGLGIVDVPSAFSGEHTVAGWPNWLTMVAEEAVRGWLPRRADSFEKFDKIGQGTYSSVYKARDLETGKIVALKKVRFVNMDPESVRFMAREIHILRTLNHPNVVKLEGIVTSRMSCSLYLVFEYMEHDLAGLAATPSIKFTEAQVKCYMKQLLCGLEHCHSRGVLHRDIKGSNLLIDNNGILRIADFGLATLFNPDQKQQLTSRVVTLWYRPPELLLGATEYGVAVDLWSTGCILAELLSGKPIMPGRTEVEQMHKIFKLCGSPDEDYWKKSKLPHATIFKPQHPYRRCVRETFRDFPPSALALLDSLLSIEPEDRGTATSALNSDFFTTKPLACDPSSLPKYPPSKELDAKLRDEEARRQRAAAKKEGERKSNARAVDAEVQKLQEQPTPKSNSDKYNVEDAGSGFPIDPPRGAPESDFAYKFGYSVKQKGRDEHRNVPSRSATTLRRPNGPQLKTQASSCMPQEGVDFSNFAARGAAKSDNFRDKTPHPHWPEDRPSSKFNQLDVADSSHHVLDRPSSSHKKDEGIRGRDSTMGYGMKKNRIHYSGPLMPPGGNMEEMLREHERQIQQAVRKARLDKAKSKLNVG